VIRVALKALLKNKVGNLYLQNFTSASADDYVGFTSSCPPHILQQNCAHASMCMEVTYMCRLLGLSLLLALADFAHM